MNIQIFGKSKCFDTKKAERWFKERRIKFQSIDLVKVGISPGELKSVMAAVGLGPHRPQAPRRRPAELPGLRRGQGREAAGGPPAAENPHRPQRQAGHRGLLPRGVAELVLGPAWNMSTCPIGGPRGAAASGA